MLLVHLYIILRAGGGGSDRRELCCDLTLSLPSWGVLMNTGCKISAKIPISLSEWTHSRYTVFTSAALWAVCVKCFEFMINSCLQGLAEDLFQQREKEEKPNRETTMSGRKLHLSCMNSYSGDVVAAHFYYVMIFFISIYWRQNTEQRSWSQTRKYCFFFVLFFSKVSFCHHRVHFRHFSLLLVSVHASRFERVSSEFFNGFTFAQGEENPSVGWCQKGLELTSVSKTKQFYVQHKLHPVWLHL